MKNPQCKSPNLSFPMCDILKAICTGVGWVVQLARLSQTHTHTLFLLTPPPSSGDRPLPPLRPGRETVVHE